MLLLGGKLVRHLHNEPPADAPAPQQLGRFPAGHVGLTVGKGIGPDGAGKTTLFRLIASLLLPSAGQVRLCGLDVTRDYRKVRRLIGYMPGRFSLYADLTVRENLNFFAAAFGTTFEANRHLVEDIYCQIARFEDRRAGALSGGMKQKLALAGTAARRADHGR